MEEVYYNPYAPVHMSDFPSQDRLAITDPDSPTQDLERPSSSSAGDCTLLYTQQSFNSRDNTMSEKHKNHSTGTKTTVWVFMWKDVVNYVLQTVGLIAAVVFGVWAIRTYDAARDSLAIASTANDLSSHAVALAAAANELSSQALAQNLVGNSLALLTFCAAIHAGPSFNFTDPCSSITPSLWSVVVRGLAPDAGAAPTSLPTTTATTNPVEGDIGTYSPTTTEETTTSVLSDSGTKSIPQSQYTIKPTATSTLADSGTTPTPLPTTTATATSTPADSEQKSGLHFSVIVGIIIAVGVFFVVVGAFLVGKKRLRVSVTRVD